MLCVNGWSQEQKSIMKKKKSKTLVSFLVCLFTNKRKVVFQCCVCCHKYSTWPKPIFVS